MWFRDSRTGMPDELTQFDDPALREAIRRVRGAHVVRPELVERVRERLTAEMAGGAGPSAGPASGAAAAPPAQRPAAWRGRGWVIARRLAVAAAIVLAFGLGMRFEHVRHQAEERAEYLEM